MFGKKSIIFFLHLHYYIYIYIYLLFSIYLTLLLFGHIVYAALTERMMGLYQTHWTEKEAAAT